MNSELLSRLSVGITFRYNVKKAIVSQFGGTLLALIILLATEAHSLGNKPLGLSVPVIILLLVNLFVVSIILFYANSGIIKLYPTMLIFTSRRRQTRIDFGRLIRLELQAGKNLIFYIMDPSGREIRGLEIKNCQVYANSSDLISLLTYLLKDKFRKGSTDFDAQSRWSKFKYGA